MTYSKEFTPCADYSAIDNIVLEKEINILSKEMSDINIKSLPFDKLDYLAILLSGVCGGLIDIFLGKPSGYAEPKIKNDSFWGLGKKLKEFDIINNPIDASIPGAPTGDHRLFSYGHDLLRFFKGVNLLMGKTQDVGFAVNDPGEIFELDVTNYRDFKTPETIWKAVLILVIHLYKDFWTARSLPIPGSSIIASLNNKTMPKFIDDLTNKHEVNLRQLSGQALSITVIEIIIRIYSFFKYYKNGIPKEQLDHKRNKMLLMGQSTAMLFNIGKIISTQNPFFLNWLQVLEIMKLAWKVTKENNEINQRAIIKVDLSVLKSKYETLETLVMLDEAIYYTNQIDKFIVEQEAIINRKTKTLKEERAVNISTLRTQLNEFKKLNK